MASILKILAVLFGLTFLIGNTAGCSGKVLTWSDGQVSKTYTIGTNLMVTVATQEIEPGDGIHAESGTESELSVNE